MNSFNVAIIGGGPAGLACGLIIGSSKNKPNCSDKSAIIIDAGHSDAHRALINNSAGLIAGTTGGDALKIAEKNLEQYPNIDKVGGKVRQIIKKDNGFEITYFSDSKENIVINSEIIVLAGGFRSFGINGLDINPVHFKRSTNQTRVMIENNDFKVAPNIYVCGLLAGVSSQWDIVTGSGAQVGVHIISDWAGNWEVVHDKEFQKPQPQTLNFNK